MRADELTPIERLAQRPIRLSTEIALAVTQDIVGGRIEAGATLPSEPALCATFGVSRPVVREALKLLEQRGLIGIRRGDGTTVLPRMKWNLLDPDVLRIALESDGSELLRSDVAALRADLEAAMLRRAAPRLREDDLVTMERHLAVLDTARDAETLHSADRDFHGVFIAASGDEIARTIVTTLIAETRSVSFLGNPGPAEYELANRAHHEILARLRAGDIDAAASALHAHISTQWIVDRTSGG